MNLVPVKVFFDTGAFDSFVCILKIETLGLKSFESTSNVVEIPSGECTRYIEEYL